MDKLTQNNVLIGVAILVVIFVIYKMFLQSYFFPPAKFEPYDHIYGPGRINQTPTYIYQMNKSGSLDDPLTTSANEGIKFSRHADFDRAKYEGVGSYDLKFLNKTTDTQNLAEGDIYYDIYGGIVPPVDIVASITGAADGSPSLSNTPAPVIAAVSPTEALVVPAASTPGSSPAAASTSISVSSAPPSPAAVANPPSSAFVRSATRETSGTPSRFSTF